MVLKYPQGKMNGGLPPLSFVTFILFRVPNLVFGGTILVCGFEEGEIDGYTTHPLLQRGSIFLIGISKK